MPAVKTRQITPEVRTALSSIEWDGNSARLTCGQLDRKVYVAVNDALETLGGQWNRKAKAHVFEDESADALEAVIETGEYQSAVDIKQLHGEFFTPDALADEVVRLAEIDPQGEVLEPSCGNGQLVRAIDRLYPPAADRRDALMSVTGVEIQDKHRDSLCELALSFDIADFLTLTPESPCDGTRLPYGLYDRVVMNPPFAKQADVRHVMHAWNFLKPGGRLVSIMSPGWTFRENALSRDFRNFVEQHGEWKWNPDESFKESGTLIKTVTVVLDKPVTFGIYGGTPAPTSTEAALAEAIKEQTPAMGGA